MSVSLKVPVALLLKNAEAKLAAVKAESTVPVERYEKALRKWRLNAIAKLQNFLFDFEDVADYEDNELADKFLNKMLEKVVPDGSNGVRFTVKR